MEPRRAVGALMVLVRKGARSRTSPVLRSDHYSMRESLDLDSVEL